MIAVKLQQQNLSKKWYVYKGNLRICVKEDLTNGKYYHVHGWEGSVLYTQK